MKGLRIIVDDSVRAQVRGPVERGVGSGFHVDNGDAAGLGNERGRFDDGCRVPHFHPHWPGSWWSP